MKISPIMKSLIELNSKTKEELIGEIVILQTEKLELKKKHQERIKELQAIYKINSLTANPNLSLDTVLQKIVDFIPPSWQYPEITCARIILGAKEVRTSNFKITKWKQTEIVPIKNITHSFIEVYYLEEKPNADEGPFLKEEINLLELISNDLSKLISKKNLLNELVDSEEKFSISFQKSPVAKCLVDKADNFKFLDVNEIFLSLSGFSRNELEGRSLKDINFFSRETINFVIFPYLKQQKEINNVELTFQNRRGECKTGLLNIEIIQLKTRELALIVLTDITERKRAEVKDSQNQKRLQSILDNMQDAFFQTDLSGRIININSMSLQMFGYSSEEELLGRHVSILYASSKEREKLLKNLKSDGILIDYTSKALKKDGTTFWSSLNAQYHYDSEGTIAGLQAFVRNITERITFERALKESEKKFRDIFENMPSGYILFELIYGEDGKPIDHRLIETNGEFEIATGLKRSEQIGRTSKDLSWYWPEDVTQGYYNVALTGKSFSYEGFNTSLNRYYDIRVSSPQKGQFALLFNDISQRKKAESERLELLTRFKQIAKHLPGFIYQYHLKQDASSYFPYASKGIKKIYGISPKKARHDAQCVFDVIHPDDLNRITQSVAESGKNMTVWHEIYRVKLPNRKTIWVEAETTPIKQEDDSIIWHGYAQDITKLVKYQNRIIKAREKAEESEEKITRIVESTIDFIWTVDPVNFGIQNYNTALYNYFLSSSGIKMKTGDTPEVLVPSQARKWRNYYRKALKLGTFETEYKMEGNESVLHLSLNSLIRNKQVFGISVFGRDITQIKKNELDLIHAKEKAEESDRLKTAFLLNISHEIRTPMNGILGFMNLLNQPELKEKERSEFMSIVNNSGERLMNTINDIVEVSKIEIGDLNLKYENVALFELMEYYKSFFIQQMEGKGLGFEITKQATARGALVTIDKHKIDSIMMNLIRNSIKFTNNGKIEIGNYLENGFIWFYVSDSGMGIPEDKIEVIFDRFVSVDNSLTRGYEGSGIGLSIVKAYVEALHGSIKVESELGKGSTFLFSIPYKVAEAETIKTDVVLAPRIATCKPTILIAEDDKINFLLLKKILASEHNLLHAVNGVDAVKMFMENPDISLVLMDIKMPGAYDGLEATRRIREWNVEVPIIAQTAYAMESDKLRALSAGCNDVITKPFSAKNLLELIQKYLTKI
jgi:PAS domain S-box-containing protein